MISPRLQGALWCVLRDHAVMAAWQRPESAVRQGKSGQPPVVIARLPCRGGLYGEHLGNKKVRQTHSAGKVQQTRISKCNTGVAADHAVGRGPGRSRSRCFGTTCDALELREAGKQGKSSFVPQTHKQGQTMWEYSWEAGLKYFRAHYRSRCARRPQGLSSQGRTLKKEEIRVCTCVSVQDSTRLCKSVLAHH